MAKRPKKLANYNNIPDELNEGGHLPITQLEAPKLGKKKSIIGRDGIVYASRAEAIVANWLYFSGIEYQPHPPLGLKGDTRNREGDFRLIQSGEMVEVFMGSVDGFAKRGDDLPVWGNKYLKIRGEKEAYFRESDQTLITIEAEIYRYQGLNLYLNHIHQIFADYGINLDESVRKELPINGDARGMLWMLEEFIEYALKNRFTMLVDFQSSGHSDLYAVLNTRPELSNQLRRALDRIFNRKSVVRKRELLPLDDLRTILMQMGIRERLEYDKAYRLNQLPLNSPVSIFQSYGITWHEFIHGKHIKNFSSFWDAREIVRRKKFQSKSQFFTAVRTDHDLLLVRKSPSSAQGGYPEFISWPDFLGTLSDEEQQNKKEDQKELLKLENNLAQLDLHDAANCLRELKLISAERIQGKSSAFYKRMQDRSDWPQLLDLISGRVTLVRSKMEAIKILISEQCFDRADFFARRASNVHLQRIPKHIERVGLGIFEAVRACVDEDDRSASSIAEYADQLCSK